MTELRKTVRPSNDDLRSAMRNLIRTSANFSVPDRPLHRSGVSRLPKEQTPEPPTTAFKADGSRYTDIHVKNLPQTATGK